MLYDRFKTEEESIKSLTHSLAYDVYPRVSAIGGKRINPDIDVLQIKKVSQNQYRLIGYEVKLMKFDQRSKSLSWLSFYTGIGQSLLYLQNGVHRVCLVLGFHESVAQDSLIEEFSSWLRDNRELLKRILGNYVSIGTYVYRRAAFSPIVEADSDFCPPNEKIKLLSNELLQRKFTFNKKLRED